MSLGCHLASVLHAFVLLIWTTISLWMTIRMTCITLRNVQTPEFSPWCPEYLINSFSRVSQKGIRILAVEKISNKTLHNCGVGGNHKLQSIRSYMLFTPLPIVLPATLSFQQRIVENLKVLVSKDKVKYCSPYIFLKDHTSSPPPCQIIEQGWQNIK